VLTVYPAESWAPRVRDHESGSVAVSTQPLPGHHFFHNNEAVCVLDCV